MHFFHANYADVMNMPVKAFWSLNGQITRVMAESDIRSLSVNVHSNHPEAAKEFRKTLEVELASVVKQEEKLDTEGWSELKRMAKTG